MVNFTKWVVIAAGLVFLGLFTQEAAASGLTGTLQRTGLAGQSIGGGLAAIGRGGGAGFSGLLSPFWEIRNIIRGFMNLGSATPWLEDSPAQGGGTNEGTGDGGGSDPVPVDIIQGAPDIYTGGGFSYYTDPRISPHPITDITATWDTGISRDLPLTAPAIKWYKDLGVTIQPEGGGISETSGGGGGIITTSGGVSSGGSNPLAAAHAAGYSLGSA